MRSPGFILKRAGILVVERGVKGSPFRTRHRGERKATVEVSPPPGSAGFIRSRGDRPGSRGLMGTQQERRWPPLRRRPLFSHHHGDRAGCPVGFPPTQSPRLLQREGQGPCSQRPTWKAGVRREGGCLCPSPAPKVPKSSGRRGTGAGPGV